MNATASIISKVWSFCTTMRDAKPSKKSVGYKLSPTEIIPLASMNEES